MRFADFVIALPFLLFMILFKIAFGIGPGESGILPLLVALVVLSWPGTARLVRGQILQIREEAYIAASRLLGAQNGLSDPAAHDSEHARRDSRDADVRGAERDLHRGVPVVHRHGRRAADAVVGQHVQRRHQNDAHASARADLPGAVHQRSRCSRSTCSATACAMRSTSGCEVANERDAQPAPLLDVDDLHVEFDTYGGIVQAVRGVELQRRTPAKRWRSSANRVAASR